jgi:hypothetical protein
VFEQTHHPIPRWHAASAIKFIRFDIERRGLFDVIGNGGAPKQRQIDVTSAWSEVDRIGCAGNYTLRG